MISWPPTLTSPPSGRSIAARIRANEDFPEPDGPKTATMRPRGTSRSTLVECEDDRGLGTVELHYVATPCRQGGSRTASVVCT